jgi:hypothetical protein
MCASAANRASTTVLLRAESPGAHQSERFSPVASIFIWGPLYCEKRPPWSLPTFSIYFPPRMMDRVISRTSSPSISSTDDEECSFSPFSKREYLLAQMRQKDELIDSLLKQVCFSHVLLTIKCACVNLLIYSASSFIIRI